MPVVGGEPTGDTAPEETAVPRLAARVVLIDPAGRTLLFRGRDPGRPEAGTWWFPPGGEIEDGETPAEAARREVREETGVLLEDVGEPVRLRRFRAWFEGVLYDQVEHVFVVRAEVGELDVSGWTEVERRVILDHRWWTMDELRSTRETVYPEGLADLLDGPRASADRSEGRTR